MPVLAPWLSVETRRQRGGPICVVSYAVLSDGMLRVILFCLLAVFAQAQVFEGKTLVKASLLAERRPLCRANRSKLVFFSRWSRAGTRTGSIQAMLAFRLR